MGGRIRAAAIAIAVALVGGLLALPGAVLTAAPAGASTISSGGPLTAVTTSPDLNCAVNHTGDTAGEFYLDTACGTFAVVGGALYGPTTIPAGPNLGTYTAWTPVSQAGPTGTGTAGDPYEVVTVVDAGTTGIRLTQTDTYVVGQESYRTDVAISNTTGTAVAVRLYRAGDCYLQDSDSGLGQVDATTGAVACKSATTSRIEQFLPITSGSSHLEDWYYNVWSAIGAHSVFPNTCTCATNVDNGAGLSWDVTVAAAAATTVSSILTFSPLGITPLTVTKTADATTTPAGGANGYTITVNNPNVSAVSLTSISDTLPAGFSYTPGSTTGATTADPSNSGGTLSWAGPVSVPGGGAISLHLGVTVSSTAGTYTDNATATASGYTVAPTGDTAPVTVTSIPAVVLTITSDGQPTTVTAGADALRTVTVTNPGTAPAPGVSVTLTIPAGVTLVSATPSQGSCGPAVAGVVTCPLGTIAAGGSANVKFVLRAPATVPSGGTFATSATAGSTGGGTAGPAVSTTTVSAPAPGQASGYVPPGGTLSTGTDATPTDNTVTSLTLPNTGPGAVVTLSSVPCAPGVCLGKTVTFSPFPGYTDPVHPIKLSYLWDKTVAGNGLLTFLYVQKEGQAAFNIVPPCQPAPSLERVRQGNHWVWVVKKVISTIIDWILGGHTGYARPSPCVDSKEILRNGDVRFVALFLSGDPGARRR